jgi:3'(2'), 5'-bisphosphate nucleotidase
LTCQGVTWSETVTGNRIDPQSAGFLDELTTLVSQAAAAVMSIRAGALDPRLKSDNSPVTKADDAAEAIILDGLQRLMPGVAVISEEAAYRTGPRAAGPDYVLVDPIDGTRELLAGRDEFTVNVGLVHAGVPTLGVIAAPALGLVWRTAAGSGAERLRLAPGAPAGMASDRTPIRTRAFPRQAPVAIVSRSHLDAKTESFLARLPGTQRIVSGSSIKLCRVAEGQADLYPRLGPTHQWDVAAGHAVLLRAGGIVMTAGGDVLSYQAQSGDYRVPGYVAWGDPAAAARLGL